MDKANSEEKLISNLEAAFLHGENEQQKLRDKHKNWHYKPSSIQIARAYHLGP